ncbi:MAG: phosphoadenosine phosphosulfate reductase family protein, partial [Thermoguttaceae bacterium]
ETASFGNWHVKSDKGQAFDSNGDVPSGSRSRLPNKSTQNFFDALTLPPSRVLRWCCSVHKSAPAILHLKERYGNSTDKLLAFVGVRGDESSRRSEYDDIGEGKKSSSQTQAMPILGWSSHELWLYTFREKLIINEAYRKGIHRVGCILCPQSGERVIRWVQSHYPKQVKKFSDVIIKSSNREFVSKEDAESYIFQGGWQARKNGMYLKDVIDIPSVEIKGNHVTYIVPAKHKTTFLEWLKILGRVEYHSNEQRIIHYRSELIELEIKPIGKNSQFVFTLQNTQNYKKIVSHLSRIYYKTLSCVGCRSCEAECFHGALKFSPLSINSEKCTHCLCCNEHDEAGCLIYHSRRNTKGTTMTIVGVGKYERFGLQPSWIAKLAEHKESVRENFGAGAPMVASAMAWFRESGLIEITNSKMTPVLAVAEKYGSDNSMLWQILWIRLANCSPLVKWFVCETNVASPTNKRELDEKLSSGVSSSATRSSALSALYSLFKNSPIGTGKNPLVQLEMKGKTIIGLTRNSIEPEPLAVLYGLYLAGSLAKRNAFTIREMQEADFQMPCVSPIAAFGLSRDSFIQIVNGLAAKYPKFIAGSFTHGLDEVRLFSDDKTANDVIELVLNNK